MMKNLFFALLTRGAFKSPSLALGIWDVLDELLPLLALFREPSTARERGRFLSPPALTAVVLAVGVGLPVLRIRHTSRAPSKFVS